MHICVGDIHAEHIIVHGELSDQRFIYLRQSLNVRYKDYDHLPLDLLGSILEHIIYRILRSP